MVYTESIRNILQRIHNFMRSRRRRAMLPTEPQPISGRDFFISNHACNKRPSSPGAHSVGPVCAAMFNAAISWQAVERSNEVSTAMEQMAWFGRYAVHGYSTKDTHTQCFRVELQPQE